MILGQRNRNNGKKPEEKIEYTGFYSDSVVVHTLPFISADGVRYFQTMFDGEDA